MGNADKRFVMQAEEKKIDHLPRVAVCLAAYNGVRYLDQQLNSILSQDNVDVTVFVSVDKSSDGTELLVDQYTKTDSRVIGLPHGKVFGGAAPNFYRLLIDVDFSQFDYVCFADQDDIWLPVKLYSHIKLARVNFADGVSSNVTAFWEDGGKCLINKAQPQKMLDYLFESSGPGCTFLMTVYLVNKVRERLLDNISLARDTALHDWLTYAVCRSHGCKWIVDSFPSVLYRQHQINVIGANVGFSAKWARFRKLRQGWYRAEIIKIISVCMEISPTYEISILQKLLKTKSYFASLRLLAYVPSARRRLRDRCLLGMSILLGFF